MQLHQADSTLRALDVRVVMVTFEGREAAVAYADETGLEYPILLDDDRTLYDAYGLGTAKVRHLIGPTTIGAYVREALRGVWPRLPVADTTQQGGDVLVDPGGIVRFHHVGKGSGYRPSVDTILETVGESRRNPRYTRNLSE